MNTTLKMHISELDESLITTLRELFKNREIIIEIEDVADILKNSQEPKDFSHSIQSKKLSDFIGIIDWKVDGLDFQNKIRSE